MKKRKLIALSAIAVSACMLSACFGDKDPEDDPTQVVVVETPTPAPTVAPAATSTPVPQSTSYTSSDKSVSITLPDSTWSNKMDEGDTISFESGAGDRILILHGKGEEAMSEAVLPDSRDNAVALTSTSDLAEGTDFEIQDYKSQKISGVDVYTYTVKYKDAEKGGGYSAVENYVIASQDEFYSLAGSVKSDTTLADVQKAMKTFKILSTDSSLGAATGSSSADAAKVAGENEEKNTEDTNTSGSDNAGSSETNNSGSSSSGGGSYDYGTAMDLYTSGGVAFGIYQDGSGNWIDGDGNTFTFDGEGGAYDQYGNYYSIGSSYDQYYYDETTDWNDYYEPSDESYYNYSGVRDFVTGAGVAFGIYQDGNGNWIDGDGNTFTIDGNGVAYDQYGNAYNPG